MNPLDSDAFVFFGATGDLAYKKIFPALYAMVHGGGAGIPIIGMARAGWTLEKLKQRARDSIEHDGDFDAADFELLAAKLRYVDGDYGDAETLATTPILRRSRN
jgi:glucose-6-phosphate 1-dehydrogenase